MTDSSLFPTFSRAPIAFVKGEGVWLHGTDGEIYLDAMSGVAVNSVGHAHPHVVEALKRQGEKLWHVSNWFEIPEQAALAERLTKLSFADRVFFCNSGAEAIECCIKTARRWHYAEGRPERIDIITFEGAFHGRTLATIAAGGQAKYLEGFGPKAPGFIQVPFGDRKALEAAVGPTTAAILIEPIQGEGGVRPVPTSDLVYLRELCDKEGILLLLDEVQTGMGRTGKFFAHEHAGIKPDIVGVAKGIGGGFPIGACLATEDAAKGMTPGAHGTTFGGNLLAMAVADAVLDVITAPGFIADVARKGLILKQKLAGLVDSHPTVFAAVRGEGLLIGLQCRASNMKVFDAFRKHKLLCCPAGGNVVRFMPPLIITEAEIDEAIARADAAASDLAATLAAEGASA
ncbi:MAG: aspartate aminotransferase family protein [Ancalomicrobiaceae bacterium]|nr:aspartate aminotransferase family protein [Ancalomicrobiaceae bacterium]